MMPRVSVLVPSYGRPASLTRCLAALGAQTRAPDEVVVGVRIGDDATVAVAEAARSTGLPVRVATTATAGVVASMQARSTRLAATSWRSPTMTRARSRRGSRDCSPISSRHPTWVAWVDETGSPTSAARRGALGWCSGSDA